jgi:Selenocysteine lyase
LKGAAEMNGRNVINFDNSAGTYPKPAAVRQAVAGALQKVGGNPGRGGHALSMKAAQQIYEVRRKAAQFFKAEIENTAFAPNCTYALNMVIKGLMQYGGHIIISCYEHNSVSRPVYALTKNSGVKCSIAKIYDDTGQTIDRKSVV